MGCISMIVVLLVISGTALLTGVGGILSVILWIVFGICVTVLSAAIIIGIVVSIIKFFMML